MALAQRLKLDQLDISSRPPSRTPSVVAAPEQLPMPTPPEPAKRPKMRKQQPQKDIEDFWNKFTTDHPGKIFTILPDNLYAKRAAAHAAHRRKDASPVQNAQASYDEAVQACEEKVAKIVRECRRINQKYRDPHFDIESDFRRSQQTGVPSDCLTSLDGLGTDLKPMSVKRIEV